MSQHIIIIGNGISGITCARNIRKLSQDQITIVSSETEHFYSRTALMYIFMGHMKYEHTKPYEDWFWKKNRINLVKDHVTSIDIQNKKIVLQSSSSLQYDKLVIATGSASNQTTIPGKNAQGVQSLYGLPDLELMEKNTKDIQSAVVVGGGLIGIEMAEMLLSRKIPVTFLVREASYWNLVLPPEESAMITRHMKQHHIDVRVATELKEIKPDAHGKVKAIITNRDEEIPCEFVGITVGVSPNISFLKNTEVSTDRGVLVNEFFETNQPHIYAIGDCAQHMKPPEGRKAVEQVWYTGSIQGETLAATLCGNKTAYNPGPWYNSAKFLDIEYQTYGMVNPVTAPHESSFYWEHPNGMISFRAVYHKDQETIIGFNVLGMRLRHAVCDQWLQEKRSIDDVMSNLHLLNFDPEFFDKHEKSILAAFNQQTGKAIRAKHKKTTSFLHQ